MNSERCDFECGRPAWHRARFRWQDGATGQLWFCNHHYEATKEKLTAEGWWFEHE